MLQQNITECKWNDEKNVSSNVSTGSPKSWLTKHNSRNLSPPSWTRSCRFYLVFIDHSPALPGCWTEAGRLDGRTPLEIYEWSIMCTCTAEIASGDHFSLELAVIKGCRQKKCFIMVHGKHSYQLQPVAHLLLCPVLSNSNLWNPQLTKNCFKIARLLV